MNTVIRCHVKNEQRLALLERAIVSWKDKKLNELGELYLVDDQSPLGAEVKALAEKYGAHYFLTPGTRSTKNGLYWSLKVQNEFPVLCCVDDMVFGEGTKNRLATILAAEYPTIKQIGMIGLFACYDMRTRNMFRQAATDLWMVPLHILYALVAHLFSQELRDILVRDFEQAEAEGREVSVHQDDLWVKETCKRDDLLVYNTVDDYAWHTGARQRTFGHDPIGNSDYQTPCFVGE